MQRTPVQSSNLRSVGYDKDQMILEVEFIDGSIYMYEGVPMSVYDSLLEITDSKGGYFYKNVRSVYKYSRVG